MIKILVIDDDETVINEVKKSFPESNYIIMPIEHTTNIRSDLCDQLEILCQRESFDIALLDYKLWANVTGDLFIDVLKNAQLPFIAFSGNFDHNAFLVKLGAISSINKDNLYESRGFNNTKLFERVTALLK